MADRSRADLVRYASEWLTVLRTSDPSPTRKINLDLPMLQAVLNDYVALADADRRRKGRSPHRPRGDNELGQAVATEIERGLTETEARQTVSKRTGKDPKIVAQAHRRLQQRSAPSLRRR